MYMDEHLILSKKAIFVSIFWTFAGKIFYAEQTKRFTFFLGQLPKS